MVLLAAKLTTPSAGVDSVVRRSDLWSLRGELQLEDAMDDHLLRSQYCVGSARTPATNLRYTDYISEPGNSCTVR